MIHQCNRFYLKWQNRFGKTLLSVNLEVLVWLMSYLILAGEFFTYVAADRQGTMKML